MIDDPLPEPLRHHCNADDDTGVDVTPQLREFIDDTCMCSAMVLHLVSGKSGPSHQQLLGFEMHGDDTGEFVEQCGNFRRVCSNICGGIDSRIADALQAVAKFGDGAVLGVNHRNVQQQGIVPQRRKSGGRMRRDVVCVRQFLPERLKAGKDVGRSSPEARQLAVQFTLPLAAKQAGEMLRGEVAGDKVKGAVPLIEQPEGRHRRQTGPPLSHPAPQAAGAVVTDSCRIGIERFDAFHRIFEMQCEYLVPGSGEFDFQHWFSIKKQFGAKRRRRFIFRRNRQMIIGLDRQDPARSVIPGKRGAAAAAGTRRHGKPNMQYVTLDTAAITEVLDDWRRDWPEMGLLALLPEAEREQLHLLQAACRERAIPQAGAIFPALVTAHGFTQRGVWLIRFVRRVPTRLNDALDIAPEAAAARIGDDIAALLDGEAGSVEPTLYMIFDGMLPKIASTLEALFLRLADRVAYAGVNAGSETFQPMPCLFDTERCIGNGALCLILPPHMHTLLEHGFTQPERTISATATDGNRIAMIDWRPAFDVYQELIRTQYGIELTRENFYQHAVHFPFGILRAADELVVRIPVALTDDGSLYCVGEVPENAMLVLLRAPEADAGGCIERLAAQLDQENGTIAGQPLLTFYCAGRRMHLGNAADRELAALSAVTRASTLGGALSLGEIGSTRQTGYPMFHNATLVCTPWLRT